MRLDKHISPVGVALGSGLLMCIGAYFLFASLSGPDVSLIGLARPSGTPHIISESATLLPLITSTHALTRAVIPVGTETLVASQATVRATTITAPLATATLPILTLPPMVVVPTLLWPTTPIALPPFATSAPLPGEATCARSIIQPRSSTGTRNPVVWKTCRVSLQADDFYIIANGKKFLANVPNVYVGGDPGNATYCTLELEWREHDVPMRLYIYFSADNEKWWASGIATRNGSYPDGWVSFKGKLFESRFGTMAPGDYHLTSSTSETAGTPNAAPRLSTLHFENLRLQAFLSGR